MKAVMMLVLSWPLVSGAATYKCMGEKGIPVFQATQCEGDGGEIEVKPASGPADPWAVGPTLSQRANKLESERLRKERAHRAKIVNEEIRDQQRKLAAHEAASAAEMARLQVQKSYANNNLAGAIYQDAISNEMRAVEAANRAKSEQMRRTIEAKRRYSEALTQ